MITRQWPPEAPSVEHELPDAEPLRDRLGVRAVACAAATAVATATVVLVVLV